MDRFEKIASDALTKSAISGNLDAPLVTALIALLAAPPAAGYLGGKWLNAVHEPTEGDWDLIRKQHRLNYLRRYADRAEQMARQLSGAQD